VDEESGHMGSRRGQRVLSQRVSGVWGGGTDLNVPVSARIRFGLFWEACSAEASVLLFLFLKRLLRGTSFFSLSCSSERLRSSSEFRFLPAANPDLRSIGGLSPMRSHALPATHATAKHKHPTRGMRWIRKRYWHHEGTRNWMFSTSNGTELRTPSRSAIQRYTKVKGEVSPYDGNML
jgi:hypothetical protein